MRYNPTYAKFLIEEGNLDNRKARSTHWVMACTAGAFYEEDRQEKGRITEECSQSRGTGELRRLVRVRKDRAQRGTKNLI